MENCLSPRRLRLHDRPEPLLIARQSATRTASSFQGSILDPSLRRAKNTL